MGCLFATRSCQAGEETSKKQARKRLGKCRRGEPARRFVTGLDGFVIWDSANFGAGLSFGVRFALLSSFSRRSQPSSPLGQTTTRVTPMLSASSSTSRLNLGRLITSEISCSPSRRPFSVSAAQSAKGVLWVQPTSHEAL